MAMQRRQRTQMTSTSIAAQDSLPMPPGGVGQGITNWLNTVYYINGGIFYAAGSAVGPVTGAGIFKFSPCKGATPKLSMQSTTTLWNYDPANGLVQVTDINYPVTTVTG